MTNSLEIHIKFPEQDRITKTGHVPVILLLGWAGCQDKYLQKYSKIYEDRGFITIRYSAPVSHVFWDSAGMGDAATRIIKFLYDMKLVEHPVFFHVFSNGGAFLLERVLLKIQQDAKEIKLKGITFDSAPGERRIGALFRVMQEIFGKTPIIGALIATLIFSILLSLYFIQMFYYKIKEKIVGYTPGSDPYTALVKEETKYPMLLFYSKKDHLVSYKDVEYFANSREKAGNKVTKICFEDSLHVKHFKSHPEVYQNSITKFMEEALSNN